MQSINNQNKEPVAIWWIKRDFRLFDNQALIEAINKGHSVLPLFIFETEIMQASDSVSYTHLTLPTTPYV